ncbi:hypothetical protein CYMTET_33679 [Cymbomonas tetramitiformis]|uniref:Uncharacterized protein n=1 Tax=Cymbomonas tetramitiformis TaxID=36881 RepID=A0AAE0FD79_9CHLO|nr:hypothetical protein CYMTET_33679 [Cymbomonas tetramitiformis]
MYSFYHAPIWPAYVPKSMGAGATDEAWNGTEIDPWAKGDSSMCRRWLDPTTLFDRRYFLSPSGVDWWTFTNFFRNMNSPGVYVDVNSGDYHQDSDSYFFDHCLGWSGLCIESDDALSASIARFRSCKVVPTCVEAQDDSTLTTSILAGVTRGQTRCSALQKLLDEHELSHVDLLLLHNMKGKAAVALKVEALPQALQVLHMCIHSSPLC